MRILRPFETRAAGFGFPAFHAILASQSGTDHDAGTAAALQALGAKVEVFDQLYDAVAAFADDPRAGHLLVVDCDAFGGVDAALRIVRRLQDHDLQVPVILIAGLGQSDVGAVADRGTIILPLPAAPQQLLLALDQALCRLWGYPPAARKTIAAE